VRRSVSTVRVVQAEGEPIARGQHIGGELGDLIQRSIAYYHEYLDRRGVSSRELQELLTPYLAAAEKAHPDSLDVIKGMSVGATVPFMELFAINAFEELEPLLESPEGELLFLQRKEGYLKRPTRCSSVSIRTPDGGTLLGHNEHWLAGDLDNVAVVIDSPPGGRVPVASPTVVCCLPAVGINGHGTAQGIGSLTATDDGAGIPRVLISRSALEARDRGDAVARAAEKNRAGGYGHVYAFAGGDCVTIETTGQRSAVLDEPGPHTNHYIDPQLAELAPPPSEGSLARFERLQELLRERDPRTATDLMDVLRDHGSSPQAVCLHPDPAEGDEASACMFSMVADVEARRLWVAPGNPCENAYEEIDLSVFDEAGV
jgi:isopenicillin-N N-acyltransferase-like protein